MPHSAEHVRLSAIATEYPAGTRKGDDARGKLAAIEKTEAKDEQRQRGVGQFIQGPSLKDKQAQRRASRR